MCAINGILLAITKHLIITTPETYTHLANSYILTSPNTYEQMTIICNRYVQQQSVFISHSQLLNTEQ